MQTAIQRAQVMMQMKISDLPELAKEHLQYTSNRIGLCSEICISTFAYYAQIVEKLPCNDKDYHPDDDTINWYKNHGHNYIKPPEIEINQQLLINAIIGKGFSGSHKYAQEMTDKGLAYFTGNGHNPDWQFNRTALEKLSLDQLISIYQRNNK